MGTARETTETAATLPVAEDVAADSTSVPAPRSQSEATYATCGHEALFGDDGDADRCDVCGEIVAEDEGEGPALPGRALYVWTRGEALRRDEPPLCPSCAVALGLTALGRWEIEEEEG